MVFLSHKLELNEKQITFLSDYGIDPEVYAIHIIKGENLHQSLSGVDAYFSGQYIFFFQGDSDKHSLFMKTLLKTTQAPKLKGFHSGITLYSTWLVDYVKEENKVEVTTIVSPAEVTYSM